MRWKIELSYLGTKYAGWQRQPEDLTIQQVVEEALSTILRQPIEVVGCGRTDTGVHAKYYVAHFDAEPFEVKKSLYQANAILPHDIALKSMVETHPEFHSRFDAKERMYRYYVHFEKDPFLQNTSFYFHHAHDLNVAAMKASASLLLQYNHFLPYCKTGSDEDHYKCVLMQSSWEFSQRGAIFTVRANRFLRGMVRLIVGSCLNAGTGKISPGQIKESLEHQTQMPQAWSVPAQGLFLEEVIY